MNQQLTVSVVIPAFNEAARIEPILKTLDSIVDEIIVVDDGSTDNTASVAQKYAIVLRNTVNKGYIFSIKKGFQQAKNDIIVTLDADGEHDPTQIPQLVEPLQQNQADLVLGVRNHIPRVSERLLNWLTNLKLQTKDCGTGFKAIRKDLAVKLKLNGKCTCGIFVLEAAANGARIKDVPIQTNQIAKPRHIAWEHIIQICIVLRWLINI